MKTFVPLFLGAAVLAAAASAAAEPSPLHAKPHDVLHVAVYGDAPYGVSPIDDSQLKATPAFIDSINADREVSLVLHVGDIHSGKQYCTEAYDRAVFDLWMSFRSPLIYTPGDNEWADCHKKAEGGGAYNAATGNIDLVLDAAGNPVDHAGGNPVENLKLVRAIFFARPGHAIGGHQRVLSQAHEHDHAHPRDAQFVENVMWEQSRVLFVALNIPGGSNNDSDVWYGAPTRTPEQSQEVADRTGADLRWLDAAFHRARASHAEAVVIQSQADMWDLDGKSPSHLANYKPFVDRMAALAASFGKPVLLLNGDSHVYRSDNPLMPGAPCTTEAPAAGSPDVACANDAYANQPGGYRVPNFHRIVVHGSALPMEWIKLTIDPRGHAARGPNAFGPFSWERVKPF